MKRFDARITALRSVATGYRELRYEWPADLPPPSPGRFFTVRAGGRYDPVLRRPFAFSAWSPGGAGEPAEASFIFQVRGRGTRYLAELDTGDTIDVLGPLGTGFGKPRRGSRPVLVAGGIGLGPMLYLANALSIDARDGLCEAPVLALGFRTASLIPDVAMPEGTVICTDDGSAGYRGTVTGWLEGYDPGAPPYLYACGPSAMMAAVGAMAAARRAPYEAALEQWMACGVGACAGCAVRLRTGQYIKACVDGPVYDGNLVDWGAML
ncbi:MAG: dihydroorotate dehydrogenase electron transfer subunit [Spirochaetales bacterium]|nr:dihydroorotate dehydrogenase electron transfer subunit [Spirochaetales bacterium]